MRQQKSELLANFVRTTSAIEYRPKPMIRESLAIFTALLLIAPLLIAQCVVVPRHSVGVMFFLGQLDGWIAYSDGSSRFLARTKDGGHSWNSAPVNAPLSGIYFLTRDLGWAWGPVPDNGSGYSIVISSTDDGGYHWTKLPADGFPGQQPTMLSGILFADARHGWVVGEREDGSGLIYETSDGGNTFHPVSQVSTRHRIMGISSDSQGRLWIYGENFFASSDGGKSWLRSLRPGLMPGGYSDLTLMTGNLLPGDAGILAGQGSGGVILQTNDDGMSWNLALETMDATYFDSSYFWDDRHGCVVGSSNSIFCTSDGGHSWSGRDVLPHYSGPCPSDVNLFSQLVILPSGKGWLRDAPGHLYQTTDGGKTWAETDPVVLSY